MATIKEGDRRFNYDAMGKKIHDIIEKLSGGSRDLLFTWLSEDEKSEAKKNFISIENVPGPQSLS